MVRHVRHKHPTAVGGGGGVSKLDAASAAATLSDYVNTWARKKFVLHSRRRTHHQRRPPHAAAAAVSSTDGGGGRPPASTSSRGGGAGTVSTSGIGDVRSAAPPTVVSAESRRSISSEDRLVIDVGSEERDRRDDAHQTHTGLTVVGEQSADR